MTTTTTTTIALNDSTATITFSNTNPLKWTLSLQQGTDNIGKSGVISRNENPTYLRGEVKSPPANPEAEW